VQLKLIEDVGPQKLRGGFYTPALVVDACWERVRELLNGAREIRVLEPSAGDGAFLRGLSRMQTNSRLRRSEIACIELVESEAALCRKELERSNLSGAVVTGSFFKWLQQERGTFNVLVGNPPFIRYQFVPDDERASAEWLLRTRGHDLQGVSNYWIPFVLLGLDSLEPGGVFSLVLPSELLSTVSGGQVRAELVRNFDSLRVDLYPRKTFPHILQDVLILSGVRASTAGTSRLVTFSEHVLGAAREWQHVIGSSGESWTRFLLSAIEWDAFRAVREFEAFQALREVASLSVAIVTGANDYFTVDDATLRKFDLSAWARPLLARTAESPGLIFTKRDQASALAAGKKCWLLDFSEEKPDPLATPQAADYLRAGKAKGLDTRYKCRIREPWYRVPHIQRGSLMMAKRSHQHHRLILNEANVFTTDTIYRGAMTSRFEGREVDLVAGFHNSATMLSAEIEGRTYGGGVLELVPSEISRLLVPIVNTRKAIWSLDGVSRNTGGQRDADDTLIETTDQVLAKQIPGFDKLLAVLSGARNRLRDRRFGT
jgi:adenine-specific DNA-methyltransferase